MRPTYLMFRPPTEATAEYLIPEVTMDGRRLHFSAKPANRSYSTWGQSTRFNPGKKSRVGPGAYNVLDIPLHRNTAGPRICKDKPFWDEDENCEYMYVNGNRLVKKSKIQPNYTTLQPGVTKCSCTRHSEHENRQSTRKSRTMTRSMDKGTFPVNNSIEEGKPDANRPASGGQSLREKPLPSVNDVIPVDEDQRHHNSSLYNETKNRRVFNFGGQHYIVKRKPTVSNAKTEVHDPLESLHYIETSKPKPERPSSAYVRPNAVRKKLTFDISDHKNEMQILLNERMMTNIQKEYPMNEAT